MAAASEFPTELSTRPLGLIGLTGLDIAQKPLHRAIWESFSVNRRPDRVPLSFKLVPIDNEYPKAKPKRTSYEWYIPKGVLKTKWMNKHLEQVPALVVVFYELDWDNAQWKEKQTECAAQVQQVRTSLQGRNTKVAVVLIQKNAPLPPGEDMQAAERAAALCSACDLSAKSLFVLQKTDHLFGYTIRLENAFYELAQSYYHGEARRVKSHKEFLNKSTHQLLLVRHQIKVAFFNELRQDPHAAVKHYRQAYNLMTEIKLTDINVLEVKVVAGFINYKICRLSFQASAPLDAISQFRKHVDLWKEKVGCPELAFEHSAWLSKQFSLFGDLFDEAIRNGLTALQTQHPGFYYQQAANNAIIRRQLCEGLCHPNTPLSMNPLEQAGKLEFYGQRPWRQGFQGPDVLDQALESSGIIALQSQEIMVDHSWIIIPLLSSAVAQFKKYKSPRMKRYLMVQMGEEYYHARDYSKALMLLGRVTWDFRHERWWSLLTSVLITSLRCAYLVGNVQEYVTLSLDLMGQYALNSPEEKTRVQMNLVRVISNECPEPEPGCDLDAVEEAKEIWKNLTQQTGQVVTVQMDQLAAFVECKAVFDSHSIHADSATLLHVHLRVTCPFPIHFKKLAVYFSNQVYNQYCCIDAVGEGKEGNGGLYLLPAKTKVIPFRFFPQPEDVGKLLQISSIALELGSPQNRCAVLVWNGGGTEGTNTINCFAKHGNKSADIEDRLDWESLQIVSSIQINPREPQMELHVEHDTPSLVNEFFKIKLIIKSLEETEIKDLKIWVGFQEEHDPTIVDTKDNINVDALKINNKILKRMAHGLKWENMMPIRKGSIMMASDVGMGTYIHGTICLEPPTTGHEAPIQSHVFFNRESLDGREMEQIYYVRCAQVGSRTLLAKVVYSVTVPSGEDAGSITCVCTKEEKLVTKTVMPFDISLSLTSLRLERLDQVSEEEPFLLLASIKCTSPWPVTMVTTRLNLSSEVDFVGEKMDSQLEGVSLQQGESASECYCLAALEGSSSHKVINIGSLVLQWRRASSPSDCPAVITELTFPSVTVESVPFFINTELPCYGCVQTLMPLSYVIHNRTLQVQEVEVTIEPSEAFMFSGQKQVQFRLLPGSDHKLSYNLYPLMPGHVALPKLHLSLPRFQTSWDEHAQKMIPTHVFVKPRAKPVIVQ